jgi:hypothetical protein
MAKTILCLLLLLASSWGAAHATLTAANSASRVLILENSTMPLPTARATLIIGPLTRTNGIYAGDFKVKVFPYFFKSDRGRLAIEVPDKTLAEMNQGKAVAVTGTATSTKNGIVRHIEITATPKDRDHGTVSLWFMVGNQKMIFNPAYQFSSNVVTTALAPMPPLIMSLR